jgi:hypothetical protein
MRAVFRRLVLALWFVACAHVAWTQTADEVVNRSLAALGGRAALGKLKSRLTTGTITLSMPVGDIEGSIELLNAAPKKSRSLIKADLSSLGAGQWVLDQRFDGNSGYMMDTLQALRR